MGGDYTKFTFHPFYFTYLFLKSISSLSVLHEMILLELTTRVLWLVRYIYCQGNWKSLMVSYYKLWHNSSVNLCHLSGMMMVVEVLVKWPLRIILSWVRRDCCFSCYRIFSQKQETCVTSHSRLNYILLRVSHLTRGQYKTLDSDCTTKQTTQAKLNHVVT